MSGRIVVGTSSWADPGFVEEWYPDGLPARERLPYYAERFDAALAEELLAAVEPLVSTGKLATFLLQLSPAFGPRDHALDELAPLVELFAPHPLAIEVRNRGWAAPVAAQRMRELLGQQVGAAQSG